LISDRDELVEPLKLFDQPKTHMVTTQDAATALLCRINQSNCAFCPALKFFTEFSLAVE